ncbi:methyltransferase domain-containing protein [Anderseniella sp. Alg231-50]|uniref:methyltransferase domain-containing protein n=1 Tax=Anderseniella sp. Alg231-50 TaxID=1922226 RepID=UPI000D559AFB
MLTPTRSTSSSAPAGGDTDNGGRIPVFARRLGSWHLSLQRQPYDAANLVANYDLAAAGWHKIIDRLDYMPAYRALLKQALAHWPAARSSQHLRALDCGTGTGALSEALAGACAVPVEIDAVDISPVMLSKAGERLRKIGLNVALRQADVQRLPYANNSFDIVMAGHILEHLPDPVAALSEMVRVARPGGLVFACITRRTLPGLWIHFLWRTHMVSPADAENWLHRAALQDVTSVSPNCRGLFRQLSLACCGVKPDNQC